jgi:hypothetical protein
MSRLCGNRCSSPTASRRVERRPLLLLLVVATTSFVTAPSPAQAASPATPPHPQPQKLWNAYPLDAKGAQAQTATPPARHTPSPSAARESRGGSSSLWLWISLAAFAASLLAFTVAWRESPRLRRARRALIGAGDNVRALRRARRTRAALLAREPGPRRAEPEELVQLLTTVLNQDTPSHEQNGDVEPQVVPSAEPDAARQHEVLKRKRAAATTAEVQRLKEKTRPTAHGRRDEIGTLKAKLVDSSELSPTETPPYWVQKGER